MRMLFGEFLIERKLATQLQVLEALLVQISALPSTPEICFQNKLISNDGILLVLAEQQRRGEDFRSVASSLGYWSKRCDEEVAAHIKSVHRPLGKILLERGVLTIDTLTDALQHYAASLNGKDSGALMNAFIEVWNARLAPIAAQLTLECNRDIRKRSEVINSVESLQSLIHGLKDALPAAVAPQLNELMTELSSSMEPFAGDRENLPESEFFSAAGLALVIMEACVQSLQDNGHDDIFVYDTNMKDLRARLSAQLSILDKRTRPHAIAQ